jgi:uncharacterized membrane protein
VIFLRRDRYPIRRWMALRVGLLFLAAGIWLAGVVIDDDRITAVAIVVAGIGIMMGAYLRRREVDSAEEEAVEGEG